MYVHQYIYIHTHTCIFVFADVYEKTDPLELVREMVFRRVWLNEASAGFTARVRV